MKRGHQGISLLELLVVLAIAGVLVAALSLSIGGNASRRLENAARQTQALIELACDRAGISGSDMGIRVEADRLRFGFIDALGWHEWVDGSDEPLRPRLLGDGIALHLRRDGREWSLRASETGPQLACLGSGELTPFELRISAAEVDSSWQLLGTVNGELKLERIDAR